MDNLARDVKEAMRLGYGVHYGNYKADHPHTKDDSVDLVPEPKHPPRKCKFCQKEFLPNRSDQYYCSEECRIKQSCKNQAGRKKKPKLPIGPAECPVCGGEFYRYKKTQTCCGRSCAARKRNLNRYQKPETNSDG